MFAAHLPVVHFVAPKIFVAASSRTTNLTPAITRPAVPVGGGDDRREAVAGRMLSYLLRRLLFAAFLVFAVSSASLVVTRLAPGDYATGALGLGASQEARAQMRARFGLDRPLAAQYLGLAGPRRAARLRTLARLRPSGHRSDS